MDNGIIVKIAETKEELEGAFKLRCDELVNDYDENAHATTDYSEYDDFAKQLVCIMNGEVVGCYRLVESKDLCGKTFACEREYNIDSLKASGKNILELSRAVIKKEYRNGKVILRLWKEIIKYVVENNINYIIGDASFYGVDRDQYLKEFSYLYKYHRMDDSYNIYSLDGLPRMNYVDIKEDEAQDVFNSLPPLVKAYIKFGAVFSHDPFVDFEFKSVDIFVLVEYNKIDNEFVKKICR